MILLLLLVEVMVLYLFYLIYLQLFTLNHDNLFCILGKYVGICGNALKLIKSYFAIRTQRVQIDYVCLMFLILLVVFPRDRF